MTASVRNWTIPNQVWRWGLKERDRAGRLANCYLRKCPGWRWTQELRLAARTVRRYDKAPPDRVGGVGPEILAH